MGKEVTDQVRRAVWRNGCGVMYSFECLGVVWRGVVWWHLRESGLEVLGHVLQLALERLEQLQLALKRVVLELVELEHVRPRQDPT